MKNLLAYLAVLLAAIILLGEMVPVHAAVAITIQDHGFAKKVVYTPNGHLVIFNRTSTFTQDDARVYSFVKATFYGANLTWNWYDPTGQLVHQDRFNVQCVTSPCDEEAGLQISGSRTAAALGQWRVDFLADGTVVFSDYFTLTPVITQENHWTFKVIQSLPSRIHGSLEVTIHPNNLTWRYYRLYMPYATNETAYDPSTNQPLQVAVYKDTRVVLDFVTPRSDGYTFVLTFDLTFGLQPLGSGAFVFTWKEYVWERFNDVHLVPELFTVSLPQGAGLLDLVGYNSLGLRYSAMNEGLTLNFARNQSYQDFGWSVLYRDLSAVSNQPSGGSLATIKLPFLPLSLSDLNVWTAVMSVLLLTASELASPLYSMSGSRFLLNRRRLRIAALLLVAVFMITTAYRLMVVQRVVR